MVDIDEKIKLTLNFEKGTDAVAKPSKGDGFQSPEEQFEDLKKWLKDCKETDPWEATERYLGIKNA